MREVNQTIINQSVCDLLNKTLRTTTTIRKWGNGDGIRIPKLYMDMLELTCNQEVEVCIAEDAIVIRKIRKKRYKNLKERMEDFYQCPIEEIIASQLVEKTEEVDWGLPIGEEIW